jgi:hypothetical protein
MNTVYFVNKSGGAKLRPTSQGDFEKWKAWYEEHGYHQVSRGEYNRMKTVFQILERNKKEVIQ